MFNNAKKAKAEKSEVIIEPKVPYNAAFFAGITNTFIIASEKYGEEEALDFLTELMKRSLGAAYGMMGAKRGKEEFIRCVGERDATVGLKVSFEVKGDNSFAYRFHTDPFPNLRGKVDPNKLDATYIGFKVAFFMGPDWTYTTKKHIWKGDEYTEHLIHVKKHLIQIKRKAYELNMGASVSEHNKKREASNILRKN